MCPYVPKRRRFDHSTASVVSRIGGSGESSAAQIARSNSPSESVSLSSAITVATQALMKNGFFSGASRVSSFRAPSTVAMFSSAGERSTPPGRPRAAIPLANAAIPLLLFLDLAPAQREQHEFAERDLAVGLDHGFDLLDQPVALGCGQPLQGRNHQCKHGKPRPRAERFERVGKARAFRGDLRAGALSDQGELRLAQIA